ncbi:zinc knuckle, partial [Ancylostoma duodenale]
MENCGTGLAGMAALTVAEKEEKKRNQSMGDWSPLNQEKTPSTINGSQGQWERPELEPKNFTNPTAPKPDMESLTIKQFFRALAMPEVKPFGNRRGQKFDEFLRFKIPERHTLTEIVEKSLISSKTGQKLITLRKFSKHTKDTKCMSREPAGITKSSHWLQPQTGGDEQYPEIAGNNDKGGAKVKQDESKPLPDIRNKQVKCTNCGKRGHQSNDCWSKKPGQQNNCSFSTVVEAWSCKSSITERKVNGLVGPKHIVK